MKRSRKFLRKYVSNKKYVPGYRDQTIVEARKNAEYVRDNILGISSGEEIANLMPPQIIFPQGGESWDEGTYLFRARFLGVKNWRDAGFWSASEFWEAPDECIEHYGRLNYPKDSVLYLSNKLLQTFQEIRYQNVDHRDLPVVVTRYRVAKPFKTVRIGYYTEEDTVPNIYGKMINDIFRLPAERYGEKVYKISNYFSNYYQYLPNDAKAFSFGSVSDNQSINVAFDPTDEHNYLQYYGSIVVPNYEESLDGNITVSVAFDDKYNMLSPEDNPAFLLNRFGISEPKNNGLVI